MNKKEITILCPSGCPAAYKSFLDKRYDVTVLDLETVKNKPVKIDFLLFTGGADVDPNIYGEEKGSKTNTNRERDLIESTAFYDFEYIPKLGICRGSQLLTVLSGGKLVQHVNNHTSSHYIDVDNEKLRNDPYEKFSSFKITSTHHQMMYPFNLNDKNYDLIAWSKNLLSTTYLNGKDKEIELFPKFIEPEIVYYNRSYSLCVQGHPEMATCPENTKKLIYMLIEKYLLKDGKK